MRVGTAQASTTPEGARPCTQGSRGGSETERGSSLAAGHTEREQSNAAAVALSPPFFPVTTTPPPAAARRLPISRAPPPGSAHAVTRPLPRLAATAHSPSPAEQGPTFTPPSPHLRLTATRTAHPPCRFHPPPPPPPSSRPLLSPPTAAAATAAVGGDGCRPASDTPTRQTARGPPTGWGGAPPPPTSAAWGARPTHPLPRPRAPARTQRACAARGCRLAGPPAPPASRPVRAPARSPPRQAPAQSLPPPVTGQARRPGGRGHGEGGEGEEAGEGGSPTARRRLPDPAPTVPAAGPWATPRRPPHAARSGEQRPHAHREKVMMVWKRPTRVRGRRT